MILQGLDQVSDVALIEIAKAILVKNISNSLTRCSHVTVAKLIEVAKIWLGFALCLPLAGLSGL